MRNDAVRGLIFKYLRRWNGAVEWWSGGSPKSKVQRPSAFARTLPPSPRRFGETSRRDKSAFAKLRRDEKSRSEKAGEAAGNPPPTHGAIQPCSAERRPSPGGFRLRRGYGGTGRPGRQPRDAPNKMSKNAPAQRAGRWRRRSAFVPQAGLPPSLRYGETRRSRMRNRSAGGRARKPDDDRHIGIVT